MLTIQSLTVCYTSLHIHLCVYFMLRQDLKEYTILYIHDIKFFLDRPSIHSLNFFQKHDLMAAYYSTMWMHHT